jgi:hypothetical protein
MKAAVKGIAQLAIGGAVMLTVWLGIAAIVVITARPVAPRQTPAPPEDKLNSLEGFRLSEACVAEMGAVPQKMLDYQKSHGFWPPAETFVPPPCMKQETDAWAYNILPQETGRQCRLLSRCDEGC